MKSPSYFLTVISMLVAQILHSQETPAEKGLKAITPAVLKAQIGFLASDWMEGRAAGEKGEYLAGDYIASMLQLCGVKPGGDYLRGSDHLNSLVPGGRSYFQNFILIKTLPGTDPVLSLTSQSGNAVRTTTFSNNVDFSVRPLYRSVEITAPVIFAGYAFRNEKIKFNDLFKIDVKGKFIMKISGYPAFAEKRLNPSEINASTASLESYARESGAAGIIEFNPSALVTGRPEPKEFMNMSPAEDNKVRSPYRPRYSLPGNVIPDDLIRITISAGTADEILKGSGIKIEDYLKKADSNQPCDIPPLTGKSISFKSEAVSSQVAVRNIIGVLEGNDPEQIIVIGAHYDHMGMKDGNIWNGADDNASGTVGALTLAKALTATGIKPGKTIIIALWSSEEYGLLGSRYFVRNTPFPLKNIRLNVNLDMISRYISDDNKNGVDMTYLTSLPGLEDITEANLKKYGIDLAVNYQPSDDPPGGSDHRSFVEAGIPIMRFKPGHREEYHTPYDEAQTLNWDIMEKIVRISFVNVWELANRD